MKPKINPFDKDETKTDKSKLNLVEPIQEKKNKLSKKKFSCENCKSAFVSPSLLKEEI